MAPRVKAPMSTALPFEALRQRAQTMGDDIARAAATTSLPAELDRNAADALMLSLVRDHGS